VLNLEPDKTSRVERSVIVIRSLFSDSKFSKIFLGIAFSFTLILGSTFAANINLNDNQAIQFGQGIAQTIACDNDVIVTPYSAFQNDSGAGSFKFSSIKISQIDMETCHGKTLRIDVYNNNLGQLSNVVDNDGTVVEFAISNGFFIVSEDIDAEIDTSRAGPPYVGEIILTFNHPKINSDLVDSISLQSSEKDIEYSNFLIHYDFSNSNTYSGSGTQVNDLRNNVSAEMSNPSMFHSEFGGYLAIDGPSNFLGTTTDSTPLFLQRGNLGAQSVVLWVRPKSDGIIFDEQGESNFNSYGWHDSQIEIYEGKFRFRVWNMASPYLTHPSEISSPDETNPEGVWYHIALVYDGTYLRAFINGVESYTTTSRQTPWQSYSPTYFGFGANDTTNMYIGTGATFDLATVRIYSRALSNEEINNLYTSSLSRFS
jgi:Concanavalin A-like lectin/glucanases superfamily